MNQNLRVHVVMHTSIYMYIHVPVHLTLQIAFQAGIALDGARTCDHHVHAYVYTIYTCHVMDSILCRTEHLSCSLGPLSPWSADLEVAVHNGGSLCVHVGHRGAGLVEHTQHVPWAQTDTVHHILQLTP